MFSSANLFSKPMSHAMPSGKPGEGSKESLTIGIRASGRGLTWNFVSGRESESWGNEYGDFGTYLVRVNHLAW